MLDPLRHSAELNWIEEQDIEIKEHHASSIGQVYMNMYADGVNAESWKPLNEDTQWDESNKRLVKVRI